MEEFNALEPGVRFFHGLFIALGVAGVVWLTLGIAVYAVAAR